MQEINCDKYYCGNLWEFKIFDKYIGDYYPHFEVHFCPFKIGCNKLICYSNENSPW